MPSQTHLSARHVLSRQLPQLRLHQPSLPFVGNLASFQFQVDSQRKHLRSDASVCTSSAWGSLWIGPSATQPFMAPGLYRLILRHLALLGPGCDMGSEQISLMTGALGRRRSAKSPAQCHRCGQAINFVSSVPKRNLLMDLQRPPIEPGMDICKAADSQVPR